jgi:hypothetical protein
MNRPRKKVSVEVQKVFAIPGLQDHFSERDNAPVPGRFVTTWTKQGNVVSRRRTDVKGVPLPKDLERICDREARDLAEYMGHVLTVEAAGWSQHEDLSLPITTDHVQYFRSEIAAAMETGFLIAVQRYADDLKHVPEVKTIRAALERGRKKGADTVRKKAAPKKTAIRKRFRELRKSGFTKTDARKVLEQETGFSFRQIERDTKGLT